MTDWTKTPHTFNHLCSFIRQVDLVEWDQYTWNSRVIFYLKQIHGTETDSHYTYIEGVGQGNSELVFGITVLRKRTGMNSASWITVDL
jgi:hypothetical protein